MKSEKERFMALALKEADKAEKKEEVPIGCVIVKDGKVVARAHNLKQTKRLATAHAEVLAIEKVCRKLKDWRLEDYDIYVTLEPCAMCAGAAQQARLAALCFGAFDGRAGCCGSVYKLPAKANIGGLRAAECQALLDQFFSERRQKDRQSRTQA